MLKNYFAVLTAPEVTTIKLEQHVSFLQLFQQKSSNYIKVEFIYCISLKLFPLHQINSISVYKSSKVTTFMFY